MTCNGVNCFPSIQNFWNDHSATINHALSVAKTVAKVACIAIASVALIAYSPYMFVAGLILGAIFKEELAPRIDGIVDLWNKNAGVKVAMIAIGIFTWPLTLEVASLWAGARWSVYLLS